MQKKVNVGVLLGRLNEISEELLQLPCAFLKSGQRKLSCARYQREQQGRPLQKMVGEEMCAYCAGWFYVQRADMELRSILLDQVVVQERTTYEDELESAPLDTTPDNLKRLYTKHSERYARMIRQKGPNIRVSECVHLLGVWESVRECDFIWLRLSEEARNEIEDAIRSGE